ncbi:uncharacterized protein J4E79_000299 [Alternaria viburni]|uniref:uncharacterized protein n=1 Tax=Alternaria viburni TaxID=566460 RepID=UPI0020C457DF|nr:uncharacterized protein J4E79_000299 [Alternaria viburni]KAI4670019.1 hypothetical protein J4E79_000299 [Alternaria viburni]
MAIVIPPPSNLQPQSALLQLPAEIKHIIFGLCFVADRPVIDPRIDGSKTRDDNAVRTTPGAALLQTCRRTYHEIDRRPLFAQNTFRFSNLTGMRAFLHALPVEYRTRIQDIEIDLRELNSDRPHIAREWLQYVALAKNGGLNSLRADAAGLRCLRINLEAWPVSKAMERNLPWSPVHFVGGDDVGTHDLLTRMNKCVTKTGSDNAVKWQRQNGRLQLEVISKPGLHESVAAQGLRAPQNEDCARFLPPSGECSFFACENRHSYGTEPVDKELSPNAAG